MNKEIRELICQNSLKYINTPFKHQGRTEFGLDCAGLIIKTLQDSNLYHNELDVVGYSNRPDGTSLMLHLNNNCILKNDNNDLENGDILLMQFNGVATHLAIFLGDILKDGFDYIIHSYIMTKKVVIHKYDDNFKNNVVAVYTLKIM
jgi:cell wall-associated NlpC family hydrolase